MLILIIIGALLFGIIIGVLSTENKKENKKYDPCEYGHYWDYSFDVDQIVEYKTCKNCGKREGKR